MQHIKTWALDSIQLQSNAIANMGNLLDNNFEKAIINLHQNTGRIIVSGIGKSAIIAQKMVATLNSTGSAAIFMHAADAIHGDIGMLQAQDVAIIISKSGESPEIRILVDIVKKFGNTLIAICGSAQSYLGKNAQFFLNTAVSQEACPNNLAPTTSTTAQLVMADAIAICLLKLKGFSQTDFARLHPGGALGKQLFLQVADLSNNNAKPSVIFTENIQKVIVEISSNRLGATAVLDEENKLCGIITDGDLRRMLEKTTNFEHVIANDIMNTQVKTITHDALASEALNKMRQDKISQLVVINNFEYAGIIHLQDLLREGII